MRSTEQPEGVLSWARARAGDPFFVRVNLAGTSLPACAGCARAAACGSWRPSRYALGAERVARGGASCELACWRSQHTDTLGGFCLLAHNSNIVGGLKTIHQQAVGPLFGSGEKGAGAQRRRVRTAAALQHAH